MIEPPSPTTIQQAGYLKEGYDNLQRGIYYNLRSKPGYISYSGEYSAAVDSFQRAGMDRDQAIKFVTDVWNKSIESSSSYQQPQVIQQMIQQGILGKAGQTGDIPGKIVEGVDYGKLARGEITPEQLSGSQRASLGLQNIKSTTEGGYYNVQTGVYQKPTGEMISVRQQELLNRTQFVQPTKIFSQSLPPQTLPPQTLPAYISAAPKVTEMPKDELQKQYGKPSDITGFIRGEDIYVEAGKPITRAHELGHYYTFSMEDRLDESTKQKISKEGRIVLGLKYKDFFGGMKEYTPEQYSTEALAIAYAWITSGNKLKQAAINIVMPETSKFIKRELLSQIISGAPVGIAAQVSTEYQPAVVHTSDLSIGLTQAREQFKVQAEKVTDKYKEVGEAGVLFEKQVSSFKSPTGQVVPITAIFYRDEKGVERKATPDESDYFREQPGVLQAKILPEGKLKPLAQFYEKVKTKFILPAEEKISAVLPVIIGKGFENLGEGYEYATDITKKYVTEPVLTFIETKISKEPLGETVEKAAKIQLYTFFPTELSKDITSTIFKEKRVGAEDVAFEKFQEGYKYTIRYMFEKVREEPLLIPLTYYGAKIVGAGFGLTKEVARQMAFPHKEALQVGGVAVKAGKVLSTVGSVGFKTVLYGAIGVGLTEQAVESRSAKEAVAKTTFSLGQLALMGIGFKKGQEFISKPKIKTLVPERVEMSFKEYQIMAQNLKGKIKLFSEYKITGKVFAPEIEISTRAQRLLGRFASDITPTYLGKAGKDIPFIIKTPFPSEYGKDFAVIEVTPRAKYVSLISGEGKMISYEKLISAYPKEMTPIQRRLTEELAGVGEARKTMVSKLLSKDLQFQFGEIEADKFYKGARKTVLDIDKLVKGRLPIGKRITRVTYVSSVKEIPTAETFPFEKFVSKMEFKDITKPYAKSTGKVLEMKGKIIRLKEPIKQQPFRVDLGKFDFKSPKLKASLPEPKVTLYPEKRISLIGLEKLSLIQLPKIVPIIPKTSISSRIKSILTEKPITKAMFIPRTEVKVIPRTEVKVIPREVLISKQPLKISYRELQLPREKLIASEKLQQKEILREMIKLKMHEKLISKQTQKQILKEKEIVKLIQKLVPPPLPPTTKVPRETIIYTGKRFKLPLISSAPLRRKKMKSILGFDVLKIVKGKPQVITRGVTREAGLDIGAREVLKNLRATFILKKSGLLARDIPTGGEFARFSNLFREPVLKSKYKKYGEVYVQKQSRVGMFGGRLAFKGELAEIKSARMNKIMNSIR